MYRLLAAIARHRAMEASEDVEVTVEVADEVVARFDDFVLHTDAIIPRMEDDPRTAYEQRLLGDPQYAAALAELWDQPLDID